MQWLSSLEWWGPMGKGSKGCGLSYKDVRWVRRKWDWDQGMTLWIASSITWIGANTLGWVSECIPTLWVWLRLRYRKESGKEMDTCLLWAKAADGGALYVYVMPPRSSTGANMDRGGYHMGEWHGWHTKWQNSLALATWTGNGSTIVDVCDNCGGEGHLRVRCWHKGGDIEGQYLEWRKGRCDVPIAGLAVACFFVIWWSWQVLVHIDISLYFTIDYCVLILGFYEEPIIFWLDFTYTLPISSWWPTPHSRGTVGDQTRYIPILYLACLLLIYMMFGTLTIHPFDHHDDRLLCSLMPILGLCAITILYSWMASMYSICAEAMSSSSNTVQYGCRWP